MRFFRFLAPSLLCLVATFVGAAAVRMPGARGGRIGRVAGATASGYAEERARIARERAAAQTRYDERERECRTRFIVTSCLDEAKAERRQAIDGLRARQVLVDEARRHERANERRGEIADKAAEDARRERARAARSAASAAPEAASAPGAVASSRVPRVQGAAGAASAARGRAPAPAARVGCQAARGRVEGRARAARDDPSRGVRGEAGRGP